MPTVEATASTESTFTVLGVLNRDTTQAAQNPSLAFNPASTDDSGLWAIWAENVADGPHQIFASQFEGDSFQARGASLNIHVNVVGALRVGSVQP